jgi:Holliday junction resolvase RusA-like endonuclease
MPSAAYKQYEQEAAYFIPRGVCIDKPVNVKCLFYMPTKRKCDLTNLLEAIDDILVKTGLLADDNYTIIESHDGSRVYYDKDRPRTEIIIEYA